MLLVLGAILEKVVMVLQSEAAELQQCEMLAAVMSRGSALLQFTHNS